MSDRIKWLFWMRVLFTQFSPDVCGVREVRHTGRRFNNFESEMESNGGKFVVENEESSLKTKRECEKMIK